MLPNLGNLYWNDLLALTLQCRERRLVGAERIGQLLLELWPSLSAGFEKVGGDAERNFSFQLNTLQRNVFQLPGQARARSVFAQSR